MTNVQVKVRLQARGGKFLGPNVTAPKLLVRKAGGTTPLFEGTFDNGASGTVLATPTPVASRNAIVVPAPPAAGFYPAAGAYTVAPPDGKAVLVASFDLDEPALVEFVATAYTKEAAVALMTSAMMQLCPGTTLLGDPGLVLTVSGLIVSGVDASYDGTTLNVGATVTMMCGCPITPQPWTSAPDTEPYWPSYAFAVTATTPGMEPLTLECTGTNTFRGTVGATLASGTHVVTVDAIQKSEANAGYAQATLQV
jgi:hypothetical protein